MRLIERFGERVADVHLKGVKADVLTNVRRRYLSFNDGVRVEMFTVPSDG